MAEFYSKDEKKFNITDPRYYFDISGVGDIFNPTTIGLPSDYLDYDPEEERKKYLEEAPTKQAGFLDAWISGH